MNLADFHKIVSVCLTVWFALGLGLLVFPARVVGLLFCGRLTLSPRARLVVRVLAIANVFGAFRIFWFGR